ncbi:helix-turn-helix domain-containing protein [Eisenbergiella tayi]|uniref:helix-turn-helix domain-containing protein n=1 Tax=Eisenbergiella tayi TaxID=1432052 RepID=UPI0008491EED|nr:helix-turn-helix domain-containing protein [Eisenbergiella tayi]ODR36280.1 hypothetical protein BEI60_13615 [Eisenbergiella tayi]
MIAFRIDRLKELRKQANLTQKQFSKEIGCTMASLSAYENGTKLPPTQTLINISNSFNCSIDWLMGLKDEKSYDNSDEQIRTYSDYIRKLLNLQNSHIFIYRGCECKASDKDLSSFKGIAFSDPILKLFLDSWQKTYTLYMESTIDEMIYNAWKEKVLNDFNYPILSDDMTCEDFNNAYYTAKGYPGFSEYDVILDALQQTYSHWQKESGSTE